jgi:hypothetical protein
MAKRSVVVDRVNEVARPTEVRLEGHDRQRLVLLPVKFRSEMVGFLDLANPRSAVWADVFRSLRESGQPAYVELDSETGIITELLLPLVVTVESISADDRRDGMTVELVISHAHHFLSSSNPRYRELLRALEAAYQEQRFVLVTETLDTHEIIDVRPAPDVSAAPGA